MTKKLGDRVTGAGFDRSDMTPEEMAANRHRNQILDSEFRSPDEMVSATNPASLAKHIGLNWLSAPSLFFQNNKTLLAGIAAVLAWVNWSRISEVANLLGEVFK